MRNLRIIQFIFLLLAWNCTRVSIYAQETKLLLPSESGESITLLTDRSVYAVNENIHFSGVYSSLCDEEGISVSTVLYAELIKWNGAKIAQVKSPIQDQGFKGRMKIPGDLLSGNYYLRAYTKWMRNFSAYRYTYIPIKIFNPASPVIEQGPIAPVNIETVGEQTYILLDSGLQISGLQSSYAKRSLVELELTVEDDRYSGDYSLSVVRSGALDSAHGSFSFNPASQMNTVNLEFMPEIRGLSLSGKVLNKDTKVPVSDLRVNLSSSVDPFYFASARSDSVGAFLVTFPPLEGTYEFNLSAENRGEDAVELFIDSDFCSRPVTLPSKAFEIEAHEKSLYTAISRNMQISERFSDLMPKAPAQLPKFPFYGSPDRTIYEKDFIELENLEEFIFELIYEAAVRNIQGEKKVFMTGHTTLSSYPVLLLMDNIRILNVEELLQVNCRRINRIEVLRSGYVIGDFLHSGIISIYSEGGDLAGMKPVENSLYFDYSLFHSPAVSYPVHQKEEEKNSRIPDLRTTLYWEPRVEVSKESNPKIRFYTSDLDGEYDVVLRSLHREGKSAIQLRNKIVVE